ncbi:MAG: PSD1 and planctomycete cytochrome C domain-containing protein [Verrucomicrobiota bacterium]
MSWFPSPFRSATFLLMPLLASNVLATPATLPSENIGFNKHIRPILSGSCFYCHGPDEKNRKGELRLDTREGALAEHDGVRSVVPGKPDESELIKRLLTHDKDEVMPPPSAKKPRISDQEIAILRKWIEQGAPYEGHWAFLPLQTVPPPTPKLASQVKNPIDQFILSRLEKEGITPSTEADRATLIRRVSLDLTGILPSPEEVLAFVRDPAPDAYERLVDRLLANPHYGERWGRHWLDQARYADSNGYTIDSERSMWPFRDWVIQAHNEDMPFDKFTIAQLAGDLLPKPSKRDLIATAFHRNTVINEEGGVKPEQFRVESVIDRVNTTGSVWLGLTLGCAQCHSHKFDPISQKEYYQMFAFFNQSEDVNNKGPTIEVAKDEVFGTGLSAEARRAKIQADLALKQNEWETQQRAAHHDSVSNGSGVWSNAKYLEYDTASNAGFRLLPDNSLLADGGASFNDRYRVVASTELPKVGAIRLRVLTHDSLPKKGPGLAGNGNFVLTQFSVSLNRRDIPIRSAFADHEQPGYAASATIDGLPKTGWAINVGPDSKSAMNSDHEIVFVLEEPVSAGEGAFEIRMHHDLNENYLIGRFALEFSETIPGQQKKKLEPWIAALLLESKKRTPAEQKLVREAFEKANPAAAKKDPNIVELMIMKEVKTARPTYLFKRGDFLQPDEPAGTLTPGILSAIQAVMKDSPSAFRNRLELAQWLVNPTNPLTPRVTVNRIWLRYFGRGIVETEEDFGSQGSAPVHPELLDWLSSEFVKCGWSMKQLHRLIVTSATYRQASAARPDLVDKDPRNLLLARQERLRVDAEILRDSALVASGLLNPALGGPGVKPPQPDGVSSFTQSNRPWVAETGPDRYRRGLYTLFLRSAPHPLFTTFDAPDFQSVCTRRTRSNTPLQALSLANDKAFFECAQALASRIVTQAGVSADLKVWLQQLGMVCFSRELSASELTVLSGYFEKQQTRFAKQPDAGVPFLTEQLRASGVPLEKASALVCVARTLLNTDTFVTRE